MPDYEVTDPRRGLTLMVTGPVPPSQAMLDAIFADAARKSAHIGPTPEDATVTLGDLIDNPRGAIQRMITITKNAVTDPRVMIPAAIGLGLGALGRAADVSPSMPKLPNVRGMVTKAAQKATAGMDPEVAADAVGVLSPRAGNAIRTAGRVVKVLTPKPEPAAPPVEAAPVPSPTPDAPVVSVPTPTRPAAAPTPTVTRGRAGKTTGAKSATNTPAEASSDLPSLDDLHLTPAEITTAVKWHEQGVSPEMILQRILQSRQLTARTKTTTPDQAAEAVRYRNEKGRWQDER